MTPDSPLKVTGPLVIWSAGIKAAIEKLNLFVYAKSNCFVRAESDPGQPPHQDLE
jgi:hypothetical protein